ncbi:MAG: AMP-binding protein [Desulfobacterales bacterium]|nr:MAG: AMP-binding protein [Desulfobacterales bacterium]
MKSDDKAHARVIHQTLKRQVAQYGNRDFFRFKEQVFGYEDFDRESDRVAAGLQSLGIGKGDKVAIVMNNRPEFLFLWFGLSKLGAIEVPINTAHKGDLLTYMVDKADCRLIVVESPFLDRVEPVLRDLPKVENVLLLGEPGETLPALDKPNADYRQLVANKGIYKEEEVLWSDPFIIMFTSGTTGPSKGSLMPHNYALYMGECVIESTDYDDKDCLYNALPLFHGNAQLLSTMPALMSGARMVLAERFSASRFWDDIKRYGCTEFNYIGGILPILLKADPKPDDADNPLRVMMGGGAPMDLFDTIEKRFGVTLIEGYGMSEIGLPLMNTLKARKPATCGKSRTDCLVRVVDDNGDERGAHQSGELLVRPLKPYCMLLEYYKMPEKTVEAFRDLWFHTDDYLYCDEEGYFHFVDRKKDALRRRGENISSYEVEKVINSHPAVLESAAVAAESDMGEDEVLVCLALKPGARLTPEELIDYCQERMAYFMIPRYVRIMAALPKTPTERVKKYELRKQGVTQDTWDREKAGVKLKR